MGILEDFKKKCVGLLYIVYNGWWGHMWNIAYFPTAPLDKYVHVIVLFFLLRLN